MPQGFTDAAAATTFAISLLLLVGLAVNVPSSLAFDYYGSTVDPKWELPWDYYVDPDNTDIPKGLFPTVINLATNATITANATCGENYKAEIYCKLVEHGTLREPQCSDCDARQETKKHPIAYAIDGTDRWWQSPSLQNGRKYEWVTITLDLKQVYQVTYVIVKAAISPRPGNWILERSVDNIEYKPWQYYAISNDECWNAYGIQPTFGIPHYRSDDEVICTSFYSSITPFENGEIHTSLVNGRPGANTSSETLKEFTKARYVRLRLQKIRTLNADLMTPSYDRIDPAAARRYFYSIKDISIGGHCLCNGHAGSCPVDPETRLPRCHCEHNTCGENCDRCCPLYNQKPWRAGTTNDGAVCEQCQCFGHADECYYDQDVANQKASLNTEGRYEGGGVCKNCKHNTMGNNCEQCADGYYRPRGVARDDVNACVKCNCTLPGSRGNCIKDDSYISEGIYPGDCICGEGYSGRKCDVCAPGYRNYPHCQPCPCHYAGTIGGSACEGQCICKRNVEGEKCDKCKPGFYNLAANNPDGCSPCYCFGVTEECDSSDWGIEWLEQIDGWAITDLFGKKPLNYPFSGFGRLIVVHEAMSGYGESENYYWLAPEKYLEKKHHSYGGDLKFTLSYNFDRGGDTSGIYTFGPEIVLEGNGMMIGYNWGTRNVTDNQTIEVPLREQGWFRVTKSGDKGQAVTREEFTLVLFKPSRLLIRAKYHTDQLEGAFYSAELEAGAKDSKTLKKMTSLEKCHCPQGYEGLSCELCAPGYRRVNNTLIGGTCEKCDCHNHANSCDPFTGKCDECLHHTTGLNCEQCERGYYGNPLIGLPTDCKPCACPLSIPSNNFSPTCIQIIVPDKGYDYVCTACPKGYEGDKCERCADGYFGNPLQPGGYCRRCDCGANAEGSCDRLTGQCYCRGNTGGPKCEECLPGFYGNPQIQDCRPCQCHPEGSTTTQCDTSSGQCLCLPNYEGLKCDRCAKGYGNIRAGCPRCGCNPHGSVSSICDPQTGQCPCKTGVFRTLCDACLEGYYGFSEQGCKWCGCDSHGSISPQCDEKTGACQCKENVIGRACDRCQPGYWNKASNRGCEPCNCNITGSLSVHCDEQHGQCNCKPGVGGKKCDQCLPGYFSFSSSGCRKCDPCDRPGHVCDKQTGRCVCPDNTGGNFCERCAPGAWGYDPLFGCKLCNCNRVGSINQQCDEKTGECRCFEGYGGQQCNKCLFGYYNFPKCQRCNCHPDGTESSECRADGQCQCNEAGQCPCKANVDGQKCDRCREETFGLSAINPEGCYKCLCFGKTKQCSQAHMVWTKQTTFNREVIFELGNTPLETVHGLQIIPVEKDIVNIGIQYVADQPLYWSLPAEFKGDKVLAYNGKLQFRIESLSSSHYPQAMLKLFPLVLLQGNDRIILQHFATHPDDNGFYTVRFHESEWKQRDNPQFPVTRTMMMVALQRVQQLLIRATNGPDARGARLKDISMEIAVPVSPRTTPRHIASGIELCRCPYQYVGTSCQDPAPGFYRKRNPNSKNIIDLVGWAEPCPCNNRSKLCDPETGICKDCTQFTTGPYCNLCKKGYYGDPSRGPCLPCACPLPTRSFSDTCEGHGTDYLCTNCQEGYTGRHCERCADGYFGDPLSEKGTCEPCRCNPHGSRSNVCDKTTGQCPCIEGITGRNCTMCLPRHVLTERGCKSCNDDCTGILLDDLKFLNLMLENTEIKGIQFLMWRKLANIENGTQYLEKELWDFRHLIAEGKSISDDLFWFDLAAYANNLYFQAGNISEYAPRIASEAAEQYQNAKDILQKVKELRQSATDTVNKLKTFGVDRSDGLPDIRNMLNEARQILRELKLRNFNRPAQDAKNELRYAQDLLNRIRDTTVGIFLEDYLQVLRDRLERLKDAVIEMEGRMRNEVQQPTLETLRTNKDNREIREEVNSILDYIEEMEDHITDTLKKARELVDQTRKYVIDISVDLTHIKRLEGDLHNQTEEIERIRGILSGLNPEYRREYVNRLQHHVLDLIRKKNFTQDMLASLITKPNSPSQIIEAYKSIVDAIEAAEKAAYEAKRAAETAYYTVFPNFGDSVLQQGKKAKESSEKLLEAAKNLRDKKIPAMQKELRKTDYELQPIAKDLNSGSLNLAIIDRSLNSLRDAYPDDLPKTMLNGTLQKLKDVHDNLDHAQQQIMDLESRATGLGDVSDLGNLARLIEEARGGIKKASERTNSTEHHADRVTKKHNDLQLSLKNLKDKILLARQKASTIRVSLTSDSTGRCERSFKPQVQPTTTNHIVLTYTISENARDSLLFFIISNTSGDFMAIEMVDRKIRFLWNAGGGTKVIQHSRVIQNNYEQPRATELWYKIEVNRIGRIATLTVQRMNETSIPDPSPAIGEIATHFSKMDIDSSSLFYVGGVPQGIMIPKELKTRSFAGCLGELTVDERPVGLWNFVTNSGCNGCLKSPTEQTAPGTFQFFGDGYAILPQLRHYDKRSHLLVLRFKSLDENALLLFWGNPITGAFVSLELREGHVVYQFNLSFSSRLVLKTAQKYNTGTWVEVVAEKQRKEGRLQLKVNGAIAEPIKEGRIQTDGDDALDLKYHRLYYGGVPPNFSTEIWPGNNFNSFFGCMKGIQIDSTSQELSTSENYGIRPGCRDDLIRSVTFKGNGFIEMPGHSLEVVGSFAFTFRTNQSDALLMLSTFRGAQPTESDNLEQVRRIHEVNDHYYSVSLIDGYIEAKLYGGEEEVKLTSDMKVNDGKFHTVTLIKRHRRINMTVDDGEPKGIRLKVKTIEAPPNRGLYFGGKPSELSVGNMASGTSALKGVIKDVVFNGKLLNFFHPVRFEAVAIGRTGQEPYMDMFHTPLLAQPLDQCAEMAKHTPERGAVKFGDALHSHIQLELEPQQQLNRENFQISLDFRTYYPNGLIAFAKGKRKTKYFTITLKGGRVLVEGKGRKKKTIQMTSQGNLNNGQWHNVSVIKEGRHMMLSVDGQNAYKVEKIQKKLPVKSPLYVGGIPEKLDVDEKMVTESFKGCIRNFEINKKPVDLASGQLFNVRHCFTSIELGAYFGGDTYAIYDKDFILGLKFDAQLEFKTTRLNGILLSFSDPSGAPALSLELKNGQVVASADNDDGSGPFRAETNLSSKYDMCDGKWHTINLSYNQNELTLRVGPHSTVYAVRENNSSGPDRANPLYIGGLPENAPRGSLLVRDNFVGCLRNVVINEQRMDWIDMADLQNVLPNSCPTF